MDKADPVQTLLAANLRKALEDAHISAADLARDSGVSMASLSRILAGQVNPSIGSIAKIARILGVSLDQLTGQPTVQIFQQKSSNRVATDMRGETDILTSFVLENTHYSPKEAARLLANAATGSWVDSWTDALVDHEQIPMPRPTLAMQTGARTVTVDVAFPHELVEAGSIVSLISVISAAVTSTGARIDDIRIPPVLLRTFKGPSQGLQGLRDASNKYGRPLLSATMRPVIGLSPKMYGRAVFEALNGGMDMTCDPTLLHSMPSNDWRNRFQYISEALDMARSQSGEAKIHAVNISAPTVEEMLERAELADDLKIGAVLIDSGAVGWSAVQSMAAFCQRHDLLLCAMGGRVLNNGPLSQQLVAKLLRFAGCDVVSIGSPLRGNANARRNIKGIVTALCGDNYAAVPEGHVMYDQPTCGIKNALPACGGGHNAWHLPQLIDALGDDAILQCGGSTMGHPWGSQAGAIANRTAVEALIKARNEGKNLALDGRAVLLNAASHCADLDEALKHWREGSFLFGVISGKEVDNLGAVIIRDQQGNKAAKHPSKKEGMLKDMTTGRTIKRHKDGAALPPEEEK